MKSKGEFEIVDDLYAHNCNPGRDNRPIFLYDPGEIHCDECGKTWIWQPPIKVGCRGRDATMLVAQWRLKQGSDDPEYRNALTNARRHIEAWIKDHAAR